MDTKTSIFIYFYQQYLVLFTIVLRNSRPAPRLRDAAVSTAIFIAFNVIRSDICKVVLCRVVDSG